ncbi:hypothetical protein ACQP25_30770 [Microtetraspora malaysiensis]|uniref:hypothetical protein n=1 Tax=Microtetraspora malaysiensis TaxID=161358 RepID=UPI003D9015EE
MRKLATILTTLLFLIAMAPAASAGGNGWHDDRYSYGSVKVSSDRRHITVCNTSTDDIEVWAEYATSFLLMHTVKGEKGGDCEKDTVIFGYITVFKLCNRPRDGVKECNPSIWIKR